MNTPPQRLPFPSSDEYLSDGFNYHTTQKIPAYDTSIYLRLHFNCPDSGRKADLFFIPGYMDVGI